MQRLRVSFSLLFHAATSFIQVVKVDSDGLAPSFALYESVALAFEL